MRVPPFEQYPKFLASLALILCGIVIGSALFTAVYNQNFTILYNKTIDLAAQNNELQTTINDLQKYKNKHSIVNRILIHTVSTTKERSLDKSAEIELEERVLNDLQIFKGKSLAETTQSPEFIWKLIDHKIYPNIYEEDYIVHISMIAVIQSDLTLWLEAAPFRSSQSN